MGYWTHNPNGGETINEIHDFSDSEQAFDLAKRKAKYGHKTWIVWKSAEATWRTAVATEATLALAIEQGLPEFRNGILVSVRGYHGTCTNYQKRLAEIWLRNKQSGFC